MFKLLTEEERQKVASEYAMRRVILMLFAFSLVLIVGLIWLSPSYVRSNARQNEVLERTRIINNSPKGGDEAEIDAWLSKINKELELLSPALDVDRPSDFIDQILEQKIVGVRIIGFSWTKSKNKVALSVSGVATTRQALIAFEERINASGHFVDVVLPVSNLATDKDIDFQIKLAPKS